MMLLMRAASILRAVEGRFADDIAAYDQVHLQILKMADMLSLGIIDQFPQQFAGNGNGDETEGNGHGDNGKGHGDNGRDHDNEGEGED